MKSLIVFLTLIIGSVKCGIVDLSEKGLFQSLSAKKPLLFLMHTNRNCRACYDALDSWENSVEPMIYSSVGRDIGIARVNLELYPELDYYFDISSVPVIYYAPGDGTLRKFSQTETDFTSVVSFALYEWKSVKPTWMPQRPPFYERIEQFGVPKEVLLAIQFLYILSVRHLVLISTLSFVYGLGIAYYYS